MLVWNLLEKESLENVLMYARKVLLYDKYIWKI
jgi:hypothetical protein